MAQYATTTDLANIGLPAQALASVSTTIQDEHLVNASAKIDSYLRSRYSVPLASPYPDEIVSACCKLAAYSLLVRRGYDPARHDANFRLGYEDSVSYLRDLSAGRASLAITADSTPTTREGAPRVLTAGHDTVGAVGTTGELRGW